MPVVHKVRQCFRASLVERAHLHERPHRNAHIQQLHHILRQTGSAVAAVRLTAFQVRHACYCGRQWQVSARTRAGSAGTDCRCRRPQASELGCQQRAHPGSVHREVSRERADPFPTARVGANVIEVCKPVHKQPQRPVTRNGVIHAARLVADYRVARLHGRHAAQQPASRSCSGLPACAECG